MQIELFVTHNSYHFNVLLSFFLLCFVTFSIIVYVLFCLINYSLLSTFVFLFIIIINIIFDKQSIRCNYFDILNYNFYFWLVLFGSGELTVVFFWGFKLWIIQYRVKQCQFIGIFRRWYVFWFVPSTHAFIWVVVLALNVLHVDFLHWIIRLKIRVLDCLEVLIDRVCLLQTVEMVIALHQLFVLAYFV